MEPRRWTLFVVSRTTGSECEHWTAYTREGCRREARALRADGLPRGITLRIRKTFDIHNTEPGYWR